MSLPRVAAKAAHYPLLHTWSYPEVAVRYVPALVRYDIASFCCMIAHLRASLATSLEQVVLKLGDAEYLTRSGNHSAQSNSISYAPALLCYPYSSSPNPTNLRYFPAVVFAECFDVRAARRLANHDDDPDTPGATEASPRSLTTTSVKVVVAMTSGV